MKEIKIKLPTSLSEVRAMFKERTGRRYKHNKSVLIEFAKDINKLANNGYWSKDISETMKSRAFSMTGSSKLIELLNENLLKLK